jgi:hypothetical protein
VFSSRQYPPSIRPPTLTGSLQLWQHKVRSCDDIMIFYWRGTSNTRCRQDGLVESSESEYCRRIEYHGIDARKLLHEKNKNHTKSNQYFSCVLYAKMLTWKNIKPQPINTAFLHCSRPDHDTCSCWLSAISALMSCTYNTIATSVSQGTREEK